MVNINNKWHRIIFNKKELQLRGTLNGGQSFRWKQLASGEWLGVFASKLWILREVDNGLDFQAYDEEINITEEPPMKIQKSDNNVLVHSNTQILRDYFQLNINLMEYYSKWSEADPLFKRVSTDFYGIRVLKQDIIENIFSFICSSNNNITRITSMVEKLAKFYGKPICEFNGEMYYSFPDIDNLVAPDIESNLRENGFGYRAKYISQTAQFIHNNGGNRWIAELKVKPYKEAKVELMKLVGVGAKVADCICLMSLNHLQAIPVDTHVYQIAAKYYLPTIAKQKTVTEKIYKQISDYFCQLYGPYAGWAQTVLFCADLKKFQV